MIAQQTTEHDRLVDLVQHAMTAQQLNVTRAAELANIQRPELSAWLHRRRTLRSHKLVRLLVAVGIGFTTEAKPRSPTS